MTYRVVYDERARKSLHKIDARTRKLIIGWIDKNLEGCDVPYCHGKALKGNLKAYGDIASMTIASLRKSRKGN